MQDLFSHTALVERQPKKQHRLSLSTPGQPGFPPEQGEYAGKARKKSTNRIATLEECRIFLHSSDGEPVKEVSSAKLIYTWVVSLSTRTGRRSWQSEEKMHQQHCKARRMEDLFSSHSSASQPNKYHRLRLFTPGQPGAGNMVPGSRKVKNVINSKNLDRDIFASEILHVYIKPSEILNVLFECHQ